jgi:hypothetical protein
MTLVERYARVLISAAVLLSAGARIGAQQAPEASALPSGTGSISGTVTAVDSGRPIPYAVVEVVIYGRLSGRFKQVASDADGKYTFTNLPAGHFEIAAQAPLYLRLQYGQTVPGPPGLNNQPVPIELADKQAFIGADFALTHFRAIEGVVTDEFGDPAPNVAIQASQFLYAGGQRRLLPVSGPLDAGPLKPTDDQGRFRLAGLAPGSYYVEALAGAFASPNAAGGFAITYFPGTADASMAQVVTLTPTADATSVSFTLVPSRTFTVSGMLMDPGGKPFVNGTMMLLPSMKRTALFGMVRSVSGVGGRFTFANIPPGDYVIQAFGPPLSKAGNLAAFAFGYLNVHVDENAGLSDLTVRIPPPRTVRGHIAFEDDPTTRKPAPDDVGVFTRQTEFDSAPAAGGPAPFTVHDDWTFEVNGMSGFRLLQVNAPGWLVRSVRLEGQDVTDTPLDLREQDVNGVEVVLTTKASTVMGTVVPAKDRKVADYNLLVFSTDDTRWTIWSRYVAYTRANPRGTFVIRGLPPGTYFAALMGSAASGEWQNPEFLRALVNAGETIQITVTDGAETKVTLAAKK